MCHWSWRRFVHNGKDTIACSQWIWHVNTAGGIFFYVDTANKTKKQREKKVKSCFKRKKIKVEMLTPLSRSICRLFRPSSILGFCSGVESCHVFLGISSSAFWGQALGLKLWVHTHSSMYIIYSLLYFSIYIAYKVKDTTDYCFFFPYVGFMDSFCRWLLWLISCHHSYALKMTCIWKGFTYDLLN